MKLLIVDDETRTRELLRQYVPWSEIGIDEVETARNGLVALPLAFEWKPDIILCDVRMPKMNGIDFARQYRESDSQCQILFLSGFSDKEYLKSAIHLKAFTYLEKPVNLTEVRAAVEAAIVIRREEIKKREEEQQVQAGIDRSLPILRQEMVRKLICHPTSAHVEPALRRQDTFRLPLEGPFTVAASNLYWDPSDHPEDLATIQEDILVRIYGHPLFAELRMLAGFDAHEQLVLVLSGEYRSSYREGRETIEEVERALRQIVGEAINLRLGIGEPASSLAGIPDSYKLASQASALQFYYDGSRPVFADALGGHSPIQTEWEEVRHLRDLLRQGKVEDAKATIRKWTVVARTRQDLNLLRLKDSYFQFLMAIMETVAQIRMTDQTEDMERRYMWKEIDRIPSLDELEQYVLALLDACAEPSDGSENAEPGKMREIVRYIHAHFHEKGFAIRTIADHVQLSETYLCAYFKKQRGQTIKAFITDTRMSKAKELLRDQNVKLFEVALGLGFADANYFTTFFKRNAGLTPSEYRERTVR